jgi:uncharacterized protein YggE
MMRIPTISIFIALLLVSPGRTQQAPIDNQRARITVNGEAVVLVKPDKIIISLGIETWDADIILAKQKNNNILKKAIAAVKDLGVPEKDIQTDYLSIDPRYKDDYDQQELTGYFVRNILTVTLTETAKVEELITRVLQAGVNHIHGVDFQTSEFKKYREQAREMALQAAREKAEKMAAVLGQAIGAVVEINEGYSGSGWGYYSSWSGWGYGRDSGMSQNALQEIQSSGNEISDTIALGKISIRANVSVVFELKK